MSPIYQSFKNKTMFTGPSRYYFLLGGVSLTGFTFVMNISRIVYLFKVIDKFQMCETSQKYNIIISCFPSLRFSQPLQPDALLCPVINRVNETWTKTQQVINSRCTDSQDRKFLSYFLHNCDALYTCNLNSIKTANICPFLSFINWLKSNAYKASLGSISTP